ncbi:MAG: hypothetical protein ACO2PN_16295 [Pyrobaculum sp.]
MGSRYRGAHYNRQNNAATNCRATATSTNIFNSAIFAAATQPCYATSSTDLFSKTYFATVQLLQPPTRRLCSESAV